MTEQPFKLTIRVVWWMQLFQIMFALLFTVPAIYALSLVFKGSLGSVLLFFILSSFAYFGWANALSTINITEKSVTVTVLYGRFRIDWDEVENIAQKGPSIALMGHGKRLVLSLTFAGKSKAKMLDFFSRQIEQRNIRFEKDVVTFPITQQKVRVWW